MRKVGIVGGMGPESTVEYYKGINRQYQKVTGDQNAFPNFVLESIDLFEMLGYCRDGRYDELVELLLRAIKDLHAAGAQLGALAANTPHIVFDRLAVLSPIPLVSIVEATCEAVGRAGIKKVALLGTRFTMQAEFFKAPFALNGIEVAVPEEKTIERLNDAIVNELEHGIIRDETRELFVGVVDEMIRKDKAEGVILGCTELPLLLTAGDISVPCFDTMEIHIQKIVENMLD